MSPGLPHRTGWPGAIPSMQVATPATGRRGLEGGGLDQEGLQAQVFRIGPGIPVDAVDLAASRFRHVAGVAKPEESDEEPVFGGQRAGDAGMRLHDQASISTDVSGREQQARI